MLMDLLFRPWLKFNHQKKISVCGRHYFCTDAQFSRWLHQGHKRWNGQTFKKDIYGAAIKSSRCAQETLWFVFHLRKYLLSSFIWQYGDSEALWAGRFASKACFLPLNLVHGLGEQRGTTLDKSPLHRRVKHRQTTVTVARILALGNKQGLKNVDNTVTVHKCSVLHLRLLMSKRA